MGKIGTVLLLGASLLLVSQVTSAQATRSILGHYSGEMVRDGQSLKISIDVAIASSPQHESSNESGLCATFTSLTQMVMDYPFDSFSVERNKVHFVLGGSIIFDGTAVSHDLDGHFTGSQGAGTFHLQLSPPPILPYSIRDVTFHNGAVVLSGSLIVPHTSGKHRAVVLLGGSGPQTRWGTLRFIADRFARQGIVALIYDKRGSGRSGGNLDSFTYEDLAGDALAGVRLLASQPEVDRHQVGILGHSEGGFVAVIAATLAPREVAFIVAEDSPAGPLYEQDLYRVSHAIRHAGFTPEEIAQAMRVYRNLVDVARGLKPYSELEADKSKYGTTKWFQWLGIPSRNADFWATVAQRENLDTLVYWRQINVPVLLVYGEEDELVPVDQNIQRIEKALDGRVPLTAVIAPGAQHNLTIVPAPGTPFFWWKAAPGIVDLAASWVARCNSVP